jgi:predicted dehydrogenase
MQPASLIEQLSAENVTVHRVGIIMNGVTGRMGTNQHLKRSIIGILDEGGITLPNGDVIVPDPVLVGRNPTKLRRLSEETGIDKWTTDVDEVLGTSEYPVYFDAQITDLRYPSVKKAITASKHIYCEKPAALTTDEAVDLYERAEKQGIKHGIVQDKLWLPGLQKIQKLKETDFFGRILSVRGEFGYWVFEGDVSPAQRPSWNYRVEDGGGIILDMFTHWRYVLDNLFGKVQSVSCLAKTHIDKRWEADGEPYEATADDAAYAIFELEDGIIAQFNSSWTVRVRRDDLLTLQVDGTKGSAVAGLRDCYIQPYSGTPRPVWNPDEENPHDFRDDWMPVAAQETYENAFKTQWKLFLRHLVNDEPFRWTLLEGAKGVQLAEKGYQASQQKSWIELPPLG